MEDGVALIRSDAQAVDPGSLAAARNLPVIAGNLGNLDDTGIVVNDEWADRTVGDRVDVWLGDGTRTALRVVAVIAAGTGDNGVYVTRHNGAGAAADRLDVSWTPGADAAAGQAAVRAAVGSTGAQVLTRAQWIAAASPGGSRQTRLGYLVVLGIALIYTGIALASTMVMATSDRLRELALLRLAGATRRQVLLLVAVEAVMVVVVGTVLGVAVTALNVLGIWGALGVLEVWSSVVLPWPVLEAVFAACALIAVVAAVLPAAAALRIRPIELTSARE